MWCALTNNTFLGVKEDTALPLVSAETMSQLDGAPLHFFLHLYAILER
jgi:hypothetical protein